MHKFIDPDQDLDTAPYWQALKEHELRLQKCPSCNEFRFPPMPACPHCGELGGQKATDWQALSGKAELYSWTIVRHGLDPRLKDEVPFTLALVTLAEGPRISARIVGVAEEDLRIGLPLTAVFDDVAEDLSLVNFTAAG